MTEATIPDGPEPTHGASVREMGGKRRAFISETLYDQVRASEEGLGNILDIEEAYEINLGNYVDFERGVTAQLARDLVHPAFDYDQFDHVRRTIGRLLDNLLSTSFSFLEQTRRRMKRLGGRALLNDFTAIYDALKDKAPALAVIEAIRDHAQHDGSSVTGITIGGRRLEEGDKIVVENTLISGFRRDLIQPNRKWPKARQAQLTAALNDLVDDTGRIEMGPLVRAYIQALSEVLVAVRALMAEKQAEWSEANQAVLIALNDVEDKGFSHQVFELVDGKATAHAPLVHFNVARIERLQKRNRLLAGLPRARIRS